MYKILNTLYIMTPSAYAHLENDTVRIDVERQKKLQVPLHHLGTLICFGNIMISPALMHRCADNSAFCTQCAQASSISAGFDGRIPVDSGGPASSRANKKFLCCMTGLQLYCSARPQSRARIETKASCPSGCNTYNTAQLTIAPAAMPTPESNKHPQTKNPLQGVTLEALLTELHAHYGWEGLSKRIDINCFKQDPSIKSSLKFLRKTPWAREKVETLYIQLKKENHE